MTNISNQLACIINISNDAIWHKKHCTDPHCNVSIYQLKQAAEWIKTLVRENEHQEAKYYIDLIPMS